MPPDPFYDSYEALYNNTPALAASQEETTEDVSDDQSSSDQPVDTPSIRQSTSQMVDRVRDAVPSVSESVQPYMEMYQPVDEMPTGEERQQMLDNGRVPYVTPVAETEEYQPIDLDLSSQKDAVREFAEAKVQAAKKGVETGRKNVRAANARLLANAFGPGLFQALTGTEQPTNQTTNYARSARKAGRELRQAEQQVGRAEELTSAKANQQIASIEIDEALRQAEDKRKVQQLNNQLRQSKQAARAEFYNGMLSNALDLGLKDRGLAKQIALSVMEGNRERELAQMENQGGDQTLGNMEASIRALGNKERSLRSEANELRRLSNQLQKAKRQSNVERQEQIMATMNEKGFISTEMVDLNRAGTVISQAQERANAKEDEADQFFAKKAQFVRMADSPIDRNLLQREMRLGTGEPNQSLVDGQNGNGQGGGQNTNRPSAPGNTRRAGSGQNNPAADTNNTTGQQREVAPASSTGQGGEEVKPYDKDEMDKLFSTESLDF
jgi:hypothetical protein